MRFITRNGSSSTYDRVSADHTDDIENPNLDDNDGRDGLIADPFMVSLEIDCDSDSDTDGYTSNSAPRDALPPSNYYCPLTLQIMEEPVTDTCGHCFEHDAIASWLDGHTICPISRKPICLTDLRLAYDLQTRIQNWKKEHSRYAAKDLSLDPTDSERLPSSYTTMERLLLPQERHVVNLLRWKQRMRILQREKIRCRITWAVAIGLSLAAAGFFATHVYGWDAFF